MVKVKLKIEQVYPAEEMTFKDGTKRTLYPFCTLDIMKDRYSGMIFYSSTQIPEDSKYATGQLIFSDKKLKFTRWEFM